ncbi:hypothetical protein [Halococcus sp. IIIV-5B]|uniref:hypothetical protein n=1 Tax=Halococcus sp. IIIV-5B TaxID=2321230 RepID=UPI0011C420E1|nr:hypothetical protein [Halococcus sp. IIIV-5B]
MAVKDEMVVTSEGTVDTNLLVEGDSILGLVSHGTDADAERVVDASRSFVIPGIVNPQLHVAGVLDTY